MIVGGVGVGVGVGGGGVGVGVGVGEVGVGVGVDVALGDTVVVAWALVGVGWTMPTLLVATL